MTFENATIAPGSSIIFRIPAQPKDTRLLGYSVHVLFDTPGFTRTIVKHTGLAKDKAQISMKFSGMNDQVVCTVVDHGKPVDFLLKDSTSSTARNIGNLPVSKHGLLILCEVMDEVHSKRAKTCCPL